MNGLLKQKPITKLLWTWLDDERTLFVRARLRRGLPAKSWSLSFARWGGLEGRSPSKKLFYFASHLLLLGLNLPGRAEKKQVKTEKASAEGAEPSGLAVPPAPPPHNSVSTNSQAGDYRLGISVKRGTK